MSDAVPLADLPVSQPAGATAEAFEACFREPLESVLSLATWHRGEDLAREYARVEQAVADSVAAETESQAAGQGTSSRNWQRCGRHRRRALRSTPGGDQGRTPGAVVQRRTEACDGPPTSTTPSP